MSVKRTKQEAAFRLKIDREYLYRTKEEKKNAWPYDMVIEMLKDPDYVKVVRCKDCDRAKVDFDKAGEPVYICEMYKPLRIHVTNETDGMGFCNNGRQK